MFNTDSTLQGHLCQLYCVKCLYQYAVKFVPIYRHIQKVKMLIYNALENTSFIVLSITPPAWGYLETPNTPIYDYVVTIENRDLETQHAPISGLNVLVYIVGLSDMVSPSGAGGIPVL